MEEEKYDPEEERQKALASIERYREYLRPHCYDVFLEEALRVLVKSDPHMYEQWPLLAIERCLKVEMVKLVLDAQ